MRKKGFFRLLTVSAVLVLLVSLCCFTVLGEDSLSKTSNENVVKSEVTVEESGTENSGEEATPEPIVTPTPEPVVTPTPEPVVTPTPKPVVTSTPKPESSATSAPEVSSEAPVSDEPEYYPPRDEGTNENNSTTGGSTGIDPSVSVGEDFGDDTNSDLVDDASVISSLPEQEETSSEASVGSADDSEVETTNKTSGNSGSSMLLVVGILLIVLGVAGLGTVVYLQFIAPKRAAKAKKTSGQTFIPSDDDGYNVLHSDVDSKADTAEIDLNSHSEDDSEK